MKKNNWTEEEDKLCCDLCVTKYVMEKHKFNKEKCLAEIFEDPVISGKSKGSVSERIQNIKYILEDIQIKNTLDIAPREHVAKQTRKYVLDVLEKNGLI